MKVSEPNEDVIEDILHALRVSPDNRVSDEVTALIMAASADLQRQGVDVVDYNDPMTRQAVKLYCKAHYGYDSDSEKFLRAYESLSLGMALLSDYDKGGDES